LLTSISNLSPTLTGFVLAGLGMLGGGSENNLQKSSAWQLTVAA
jgi:hypothetical protein